MSKPITLLMCVQNDFNKALSLTASAYGIIDFRKDRYIAIIQDFRNARIVLNNAHCGTINHLNVYNCIVNNSNVIDCKTKIMAKPIKETPVLTGQDAKNFIKQNNEITKATADHKERVMQNYNALKSIEKFATNRI